MSDACACAANWRVELTDLLTGAVRHVITPTQFEFETAFQEAGRGSVTFNRRGTDIGVGPQFVHFNDMEPYTTGIFFQRVHGGAATPNNPVNMFGGYIETMDSGSDGMTTLGFAEIQKYLDFRMIRSDLVFTGVNQNAIAQNLVDYARGTNTLGGSTDPAPSLGIPLIGGFAGAVGFLRDRTYLGVDRVIIGEAIKNLLQILDGPVYLLNHYRSGPIVGLTDTWYSEMLFRDDWFQATVPRIAWHHLNDLKVGFDGTGKATQIDAFGEPNADGSPRIVVVNSPYPFEPRYDAAPTFDGVTNLITLQNHGIGYQDDHRDGAMNVQLFLSGVEYGQAAGDITLTLDDLVPGNIANIDIRSPAWVIEGGPDLPGTHVPSIGRVSVAAGLEGPEQVTVQIIVDSFPGNMLSGPPDDCVDC